jgi:hypothetical protein
MTWHSAARAQGGGKYLSLPASVPIVTVQIIPPTPINKKRVVSSASEAADALVLDMIGHNSLFTAPDDAVILAVYMKNMAGERFSVRQTTVSDEGGPASLDGPLILEEGESIEIDYSGGSLEVLAQWADVQGPLKLNRIALTTTYQDILPPPLEGRVHLPLTSLPNMDLSYSLAKVGSTAGGQLDVRRLDANGATVFELIGGGIIATPGTTNCSIFVVAQATLMAYTVGQRLQAKTNSAIVGKQILVVPYLDIEDTDY